MAKICEFTAAQRRAIDLQLAPALKDVREGRTYGPFDTAEEAIASMKAEIKKHAAKRLKRRR